MVKNKLESTLDDLEDTLDREKRQRSDTEKHRRKVEADLKISQDMVGEIERGKKELEAVVARRERDIYELAVKLEEEQAGAAKQQRFIKELNSKLQIFSNGFPSIDFQYGLIKQMCLNFPLYCCF